MTSDKEKKLFVGPAKTSWWKFAIAQKITSFRASHSSLRKIPKFDEWVTQWALDVVIGSRDIEITEE